MSLIHVDLDIPPIAIDQQPVIHYTAVSDSTREDLSREVYHKLWREFHTKANPTSEWFSGWINRIPNIECGCLEHLRSYLAINTPLFNDWPRYTWELHNAVNEKLGKPIFTWQAFVNMWRPDLIESQSKIGSMLLVTSLSPLPHHRTVQEFTIESWKRFGFDIVSVNLKSEIKSLKSAYSGVEWVVTTKTSDAFRRRTPTINSLLDVSIKRDIPIVLINSDCALFGPQSLITDVQGVGIGIRHNWTDAIGLATPEPWGLDMVIMKPEHARSVPKLPFCIGQVMWDYWIAWHLEHMKYEIQWIADRLIFHKLHDIHWLPEECSIGRGWIKEKYGIDMDWAKWRERQPFTFSELRTHS